MGTSSAAGSVPSVDRALNLLELLASTATGLNLSMISRRLNIPKSSAHYLVTTLLKRNLVWLSADRRVYTLGMRVRFSRKSVVRSLS